MLFWSENIFLNERRSKDDNVFSMNNFRWKDQRVILLQSLLYSVYNDVTAANLFCLFDFLLHLLCFSIVLLLLLAELILFWWSRVHDEEHLKKSIGDLVSSSEAAKDEGACYSAPERSFWYGWILQLIHHHPLCIYHHHYHHPFYIYQHHHHHHLAASVSRPSGLTGTPAFLQLTAGIGSPLLESKTLW